MSLEDSIRGMEELVARMRYVSEGMEVRSEDHNLLYQFVGYAISAVRELYSEFKRKTGRSLPKVELWLRMAEERHLIDRLVFSMDRVIPPDHNLIIDCLKPLELCLIEMERNL